MTTIELTEVKAAKTSMRAAVRATDRCWKRRKASARLRCVTCWRFGRTIPTRKRIIRSGQPKRATIFWA